MKSAGRRRDFYTIIAATCLMVIAYAVLHDQYLVRIAPERFTVYHEPLWGIDNPPLLAAAYALCAGLVPGLALGFVCALIAQCGERLALSPAQVLRGVACVILATELLAAATGIYVYLSGNLLYPHDFYPDKSLPLVTTQTIQLTAYFAGAAFSCIYFAILLRRRLSASSLLRAQRAAIPRTSHLP
jgi:hypothetical protein